jgi:hypothetical protein
MNPEVTPMNTSPQPKPPATTTRAKVLQALHIKSQLKVVLALAAAAALQLALVASFAGAMSRPVLHDAVLGLVARPGGSQAPAAAVPQIPGVSFRVLATPAAAVAEVRDGALPAALLAGTHRDTLVVADAAGLTLVTAITQAMTAQAARADLPLAVDDVRPLPPGDPRGLGSFLLVVGWIIGGYLGLALLARVLGRATTVRTAATTLGWAAVYAAGSAALGVLLVDPLMGVLTGHPWTLFAAGSLIVFASAACTCALISLLGMPGIVVAIVLFVLLGNPTSAGSVPVQMLSGGYRFLAGVLPTNAGVALVRGIAYFDGNQVARPLLLLSVYAGASLLACFGPALRRNRVAAPPAASAPGQRAAVPNGAS